MPLASLVGQLALVLLASSSEAAAPPQPDACEAASPHITLTAENTAKAHVVCISPDVPLTFRFDAPLQPESVRLEERERFEDVAPGQQSLFLVPPENLEAGERFKVEVCFADNAAPKCASFLLLAHPGLGRSQVKVSREPRPVESCQEAEKAAQAETQQCREEVRQLRAERSVPEGLRGTIASGLLGKNGITIRDLSDSVTTPKENALMPYEVRSYRAEGRVAVEVWLENPGMEPWMAAGAVLRGPNGDVLKPMPLWQPEPILPGRAGTGEELRPRGRVVVEVLASAIEARGTYTLSLWDEDKKHTITLGNVTFP
ncbi:DUF2381 family protein [Archangium lansingense]|uniref:DUF2381 family protein n=1 Tax=Archangium lansingense TaxID=2995310 RepID=A0ABT3ZW55_9BACT|nr:DUF2381 family protein [Archangium lansinium]MCY1073630.1 DUF2381 family protein [Archangium lansinium]